MPNIVYGLLFIFIFVLGASYMVWKDERKKVIDLTNELNEKKDQKTPKLSAEFDVFAVAPAGENNKDSILTITADIKNIGAPSIISNIGLIIKRDGREYLGENIVLTKGETLLEGDGLKLSLKEEDNLIRKGISNPIPNGGALSGWHIFLVRNLQGKEIYDPKTVISFSYKDVTDKLYTKEKQMNCSLSKLIDGTKLQHKS